MDQSRRKLRQGAPLNAPGDRLGVTFSREGPSIGPVALLHKVGGVFEVRPMDELEYVLGLAFDQSVGAVRYLPALEGIARALNAGDHAQAMLRTQLLNLPRLPEEEAYTDIQDKGMKMLFAASGILEASRPDRLLALAPLLDDPDPGVRSDTAGRMIGVIPERAVAMLEELKDSDHLEAARTARTTLLSYTMRTGGDWLRYA